MNDRDRTARQVIAYDLHDGLAQQIAAAVYHFRTFREKYPPEAPSAIEELNAGLRLLTEALSEVRRLVSQWRPSTPSERGLIAALQTSVFQQLGDDGPQIEFVEDLGSEPLPAAVETSVFRIIQEAVRNARRHSQGHSG